MTSRVGRQFFLMGAAGMAAFIVVQLSTFLLLAILPRAEGQLWPVVENVVVETIANSPNCEDCIALTGEFTKIRECTFLDLLVIYQTPTGGEVGVPVRFTNGTIHRGEGIHSFGPWEVDLSQDQFEESTIVEAYHQCHPLWVTITRFHPPIL